jgi:hypothetical protein
VDEEGYDFEAFEWSWTIADIPFMYIPSVSVVEHVGSDGSDAEVTL